MQVCFATDYSTISQRTITADGFLVVPGVIAKANNVQEYFAGELDLPGDPSRIVRLYRPLDEVAKAAPSFAGKPITNGHPPGKWVDAENWKQYAVGDSADVEMVGDEMRAVLTIRDKAAIEDIMSGRKTGLSNGYKFAFDDKRTTTPSGVAVDGWMVDIQGNHIAGVERGRGGPTCVVADEENEKETIKMSTRATKIGKLSFELDCTAADAVDVERAEKDKFAVDLEAALKMAQEQESKAIASDSASKEHLARATALDAEVKALKATPTAPDPAVIEALAEERATVVADAAVLAPDLKTAGLAVDQIRRQALAEGTAKNAGAKVAVDAALTGVAADKATSEIIKSAFSVAVSSVRTAKAAVATDSIAVDMLRAGSGQEAEDKSQVAADDGSDLVGYERYKWNMCHPNKKTASV
jgi:hypothetical protein